jgi:threonine dehydrogenase-like Zn-dependent dehydrogenase
MDRLRCRGHRTNPPQRVRYSGAVTTNVAIVGGGFVGLWTALMIKRRDAKRQSRSTTDSLQ